MDAKKRMNYSVDMDPHFIAISILVILYSLKRFNFKTKFKYPQKFSSLIYFVNSVENVSLFKLKLDENYKLKLTDYERLNNLYLKSKLIEPQVNRVLNSLKDQGYIESEIVKDEVCIYLNKSKCTFIEQPIFIDLIDNSKEVQKYFKTISSIAYDTYYQRLFKGIEYNE